MTVPAPSLITEAQRAASGWFSQSQTAPSLPPVSSSTVATIISSPCAGRQPSRTSDTAAITSAAVWFFMSWEPRPQSSPPAMSPDHGSRCQSSGSASTVSTCDSSTRRGPSASPGRRATRFGRSSVRPSRSTSKPTSRSRPARCSWHSRSAPGGLTVLKRTRRCSSSAVSCSRSSAIDRAGYASGDGLIPTGSHTHRAMDQLFDTGEPPRGRTAVPPEHGPLAARMRPRTLDEVVGQEHVLAPGSALRTAIEQGRPHSMVLYGPPGSGKTTIARIVATSARAAFEELSAVEAGRAEVRQVLERAAHRRQGSGEPTIFFLDEFHRFNKAQQDALLPAVEECLVTLIGATTETPYFEVNSALLSRTQVYELHALEAADVEVLLRRALDRGECGDHAVADEVVAFLAARAGGDARTALAALELGCETVPGGDAIALERAEDALQRRALTYDKTGARHYDTISAWIKATRGSDPDASLYSLAVMIEGGEDPRFIARRMVVLASGDIGNAEPRALLAADAAARAVDRVGLPECALTLSQAAAYLALAPKSNAATTAISEARREVRERGAKPPPAYLRDAHYPGAAKLGRGRGYVSPHDEPGGVAEQPLLPEGLEDARFYRPVGRGFEEELG